MKDHKDNPVGRAKTNPILDTRMFKAAFIDRTTHALAADVIWENMFVHVDHDGQRFMLLKEIVDHRANQNAVLKQDALFTSKNGQPTQRITTKVWELLIQWKDSSEKWTKLKDTKEANPVETAEDAVQARIHNEPAFA